MESHKKSSKQQPDKNDNILMQSNTVYPNRKIFHYACCIILLSQYFLRLHEILTPAIRPTNEQGKQVHSGGVCERRNKINELIYDHIWKFPNISKMGGNYPKSSTRDEWPWPSIATHGDLGIPHDLRNHA